MNKLIGTPESLCQSTAIPVSHGFYLSTCTDSKETDITTIS